MSTVSGGVIHALSVSQVESFDPAQTGGCPRRWWFERVQGLRPEQSEAQTEGDIGHELLAHYLTTGEAPKGRVKMGKAVTGAIAAGHLPAPGPDLLVERRFDGQPKRDARGDWVPLDVAATLKVGGIPWDGFVDLRFRRSDAVDVLDHKFSSDIHAYARPANSLIRTVQMPVYCLDSLRIWPDARRFRLTHHYVSRRGVESFVRSQVVSVDQVWEREAQIRTVVADMRDVAQAATQEDVPFNRRACSAWRGCPHQSICSAYKEQKLNLSPEEAALFGDLDPAPVQSQGGQHRTPPPDAAPSEPRPATEGDTADRFDAPDVPMPVASVPQAQPAPVCDACGTELNAENGSRRNDRWTHIGCPATAAATPAPSVEPAPRRRGRPPGSTNKPKAETLSVTSESAAQINQALDAAVAAGVAHAQAKFGPGGPEDLTKPEPDPRARPGELLAAVQERAYQDANPPIVLHPKDDPRLEPVVASAAPMVATARQAHTVSGGVELRVVLDVSPALMALIEGVVGRGKA